MEVYSTMERKLINTQTWLMISLMVDAGLAHPQNAGDYPPPRWQIDGKIAPLDLIGATSGGGRTASANSETLTAATRGRAARTRTDGVRARGPIKIKTAVNFLHIHLHNSTQDLRTLSL